MTTRQFPLADILSITTEKLLSRREMDGVTDILNWMTGDDLEKWQLLRAGDECATALVAQHPFLAGLKPPATNDRVGLYAWLVEAERVHGDTLEITALTDWTRQDPGIELLDRLHLAQLRVADEKPEGAA